MKHNSLIITLLSVIMLTLTGCAKETCSYCGEEKYCEKYDVLDTTRYICKECMENPDVAISGNVVSEYQAPPLDPEIFGVGSDKRKQQQTESENSDVQNNTQNADQTTDTINESNTDDANINTITTDNTDTNSDTPADSQQATSPSSQQNNSSDNSIIDRINTVLAISGLTVSSKNDNYQAVDDVGNYVGIDILLESSSSNTMVIRNYSKNNPENYQTIVTAAIAAYLNETDPNGLSREVFSNTKQYGNYNQNGCKFYYFDDVNDDTSGNTYEEFNLTN